MWGGPFEASCSWRRYCDELHIREIVVVVLSRSHRPHIPFRYPVTQRFSPKWWAVWRARYRQHSIILNHAFEKPAESVITYSIVASWISENSWFRTRASSFLRLLCFSLGSLQWFHQITWFSECKYVRALLKETTTLPGRRASNLFLVGSAVWDRSVDTDSSLIASWQDKCSQRSLNYEGAGRTSFQLSRLRVDIIDRTTRQFQKYSNLWIIRKLGNFKYSKYE